MSIKRIVFGLITGFLIIGLLLNAVFHAPVKNKGNRMVLAGPMQQAKPLTQTISQAEIVVVARLTKYTPAPKPPSKQRPPGTFATGAISLIVKPPGLYSFSVIQTLKGQCGPDLQLNLPFILSVYYGNADLTFDKGQYVLILLQRNAGGGWIPVDNAVPMIRLADNPQVPKDSDSAIDVKSRVISLLLDSLADPTIRRANTYLLRSIVAPQIPRGLTAYIDDPDLAVQDNVLYSMAVNQQISSIPRIARLEAKLSLQNSGTEAVVEIQKFQTPKAVPYLNPLLFEVPQWTRINAMLTLQKLADHTSIPYLMLALRDPEHQHIVDYSAYTTLYRLIPDLGLSKDWSLFEIQRKTERQRLYTWWKDELNGKHLKPSNTKDQLQMSQQEISTLPIDKLNPLLFNPITATRQEAITALEKRADTSSIPYLILALIDPDNTVSYDAYVTLFRLIPTLGTPNSSKEFEANTDAATAPIYTWWEDELNGNHIPVPKRM